MFSEAGANQTFYVYCTSMSHVWKTSDWVHFTDERSNTQFDFAGMSTNGKSTGSWWAPGIVYDPASSEYVMWVSVPDAMGTRTTSGWDTRSLAVFTSPTPTGTWTFRALGVAASAVGQHFIDPFPFRDPSTGKHYVYWKQYGGGVSSSIMGAQLGTGWKARVSGTTVEIMNGYGGPGTWEDNVRENPAVWFNPSSGNYHLIFSGGHWADDSYGTGHALSTCGPLCVSGTGAWHIVSSGDRGIAQAVQSNGDANFTHGGPGGAVFQDESADLIVYAAAAKSASGDSTRYLMREPVKWKNGAPYVDTAHHFPVGF